MPSPSPVPLFSAYPAFLPPGDPMQACLFGATTHLGPCCCSHKVIEARVRTSTENMGQRACKCVCLCVCVCAVCVVRARESQRQGIRQRQRHTLTVHVRACQGCHGAPKCFSHKPHCSQEGSVIKRKIKCGD